MKRTNRTTLDYLDAIRAKLGEPGQPASDYAAAKALGVSRQAVSRYRTGRGGFDDDVAIRAAEILGIPAERLLVEVQIERDAPPEVRQLWQRIAARMAAASLSAAVAAVAVAKPLVCILCQIVRDRRRWHDALDVLDALS